jgi:hypothetical protein
LFRKPCNVGVEDDEDPPPIALRRLEKSVCSLLALVPVVLLAPAVPATLVSKLLKKFCNVGEVDEVDPPLS